MFADSFVFSTSICVISLQIFLPLAWSYEEQEESSQASTSLHWSYEEQDKWPESCRGDRQSPINIDCHKVKKKCNIPTLKLQNLELNTTWNVNNNHTIYVKTNHEKKPILIGGGLDGFYIFDNLHFHWPGEHILNHRVYDLEAHLVFYSSKYPDLNSASMVEHGIAVVGLFFNKNSNVNDPEAFIQLAHAATEVANRTDLTWTTQEFVLQAIFPMHTKGFYSYFGSLTTPYCNEVVDWFIFDKTGEISPTTYKKLTTIYDSEYKLLKFTKRDVQPLNGRKSVSNKVATKTL